MITRNFLNYIGSKDRLLTEITNNIDYSKINFVDLFCGSGVVTANLAPKFKASYMNDMCWQLMKLHEYILSNSIEQVLLDIEKELNKYNLNKTNKEGFLQAREFYNQYACNKHSFYPPLFYMLVMHSFNYSIHINAKGGFNVPFGCNRSSFNKSIKNKLIRYKEVVQNQNIYTSSFDFNYFINLLSEAYLGDLSAFTFYIDPPYLASDSSYSRVYGLKWDEKKEISLYNSLDVLNNSDATFLVSNVIENGDKINRIFYNWAKKYNIIEVSSEYKNCNYQKKCNGKVREVLVRNY